MIALLAVMMLEVPPNICDDVEKELIEYNEMTGAMRQSDINKIVGRCRATWGPGGTVDG